MRFQNFTPVALKDSALFTPIRIGSHELQHRVVLASLTRQRNVDTLPTELSVAYYDQRSKLPGTLIITEATAVSFKYGSTASIVPTMSHEEHVSAWKPIHGAIHENGSVVFQQLWALGRKADPGELARSGRKFIGASDDQYAGEASETIALKNKIKLQGLSREEIKECIGDYVNAARRSLESGADGVEIHAAYGCLPLQFLDPVSNKRTDEYGGSIENRARFVLEIVDALIGEVGADKVGIRLSPFAIHGEMTGYRDPVSFVQHAYVVGELERRARAGERLAYIHIVEPIRSVPELVSSDGLEKYSTDGHSGDFIYTIWNGVVIRVGDYALNPELAREHSGKGQTLIAYGRPFISNPDLAVRLRDGLPLTEYTRGQFYTAGARGYTDYPTYEEIQSS